MIACRIPNIMLEFLITPQSSHVQYACSNLLLLITNYLTSASPFSLLTLSLSLLIACTSGLSSAQDMSFDCLQLLIQSNPTRTEQLLLSGFGDSLARLLYDPSTPVCQKRKLLQLLFQICSMPISSYSLSQFADVINFLSRSDDPDVGPLALGIQTLYFGRNPPHQSDHSRVPSSLLSLPFPQSLSPPLNHTPGPLTFQNAFDHQMALQQPAEHTESAPAVTSISDQMNTPSSDPHIQHTHTHTPFTSTTSTPSSSALHQLLPHQTNHPPSSSLRLPPQPPPPFRAAGTQSDAAEERGRRESNPVPSERTDDSTPQSTLPSSSSSVQPSATSDTSTHPPHTFFGGATGNGFYIVVICCFLLVSSSPFFLSFSLFLLLCISLTTLLHTFSHAVSSRTVITCRQHQCRSAWNCSSPHRKSHI